MAGPAGCYALANYLTPTAQTTRKDEPCQEVIPRSRLRGVRGVSTYLPTYALISDPTGDTACCGVGVTDLHFECTPEDCGLEACGSPS